MAEPADFDPNELLQQAMKLHQAGNLQAAEPLYRKLLHRFPSHIQLLNVVGALELQLGNVNKGVALLGRSLGLKPDQPDVLANRALGLRAMGQFADALEAYDAALKYDPDNPQLQASRGFVLMAQGREDEALACYEAVIARTPNDCEAFYNRGTIYLRLERNDAALEDFNRALALKPDHIQALLNRGLTLIRLDRREDALQDYQSAVHLTPDSAPAWDGLSNALKELNRPEEALAACDQALELAPDDISYHYNRGCVLVLLKREAEALPEFDTAIAGNPRYDAAYNNRGNALIALGRLEEALASLNRAIAINPHNVGAYTNRGNVLRSLDRPEEALTSFDRAIAINPELPEAQANKAVTLLQLGRFEEGWKLYEWRWKCEEPSRAFLNFSNGTIEHFREDVWHGEALPPGTRVLVHSEQGLGDNLQFCRYVPMLRSTGVDVIYQVPEALKTLMHTLRGDVPVYANGEKLPEFDIHCPVMSLPHALGTTVETIPAAVPYLHADPVLRDVWQERLGPKTTPRIGLAWSGNPKHSNDAARSLSLETLAPLFDLPFEFHAVQKDLRDADRTAADRFANFKHHGEALTNFAETAALISKMDLVISVDTSVAHLTGALARPLWLMLTHVSEWRWFRERNDSPWYPTAKLYRQRSRGDWDALVMEIAASLVSRFGDTL